jgi:hypothetical protein
MDLNLANIGQDTATYAISLVQIRMREDGGFESITVPDPGQRFADRNIRFFPRAVTLAPAESQVVKVQLIRSEELTQGEYRSHFYFRAVPKINPLGDENAAKDTGGISIKLTPIFGITIPVIIRVGNYDATISLSEGEFRMANDTIPTVGMRINRAGSMSVYGDLTVDHISPQGKITRVGTANGVAVYTPNTTRKFSFALNPVKEVDFKTGKLKVVYTTSSDFKQSFSAETIINLH